VEPIPLPEGEEFVDPNQAYVDAMSEAEQEAYWAALYGAPVFEEDVDPDAEIPEWNPEDSGCQGKAWAEIQRDPDVIALNEAWVACMADAGYSEMKDPNNAAEPFYERSNQIYEDIDWGETEAEWAAAEAAIEEALTAMRDDEIAAALADFDCREEIDFEARYRTVDHRLQQECIARHGAELEACREAMEQRGAL